MFVLMQEREQRFQTRRPYRFLKQKSTDIPFPLSTTSALVLLWSGADVYRSPIVREYWKQLDLSAGRALFDRCNEVWPHYSQVIQNRKWLLDQWSDEILNSGEIAQTVILAAGLAPLGLDLAARFPRCRVFDVDMSLMPEKAQLVAGIHNAPTNLHFVTADITDRAACKAALVQAGWQPEQATLLIIEGISYYISRAQLIDLHDMVAPGSQVLLEYMVPEAEILAERRHIPREIFQTIVEHCGVRTPIEVWNLAELAARMPGKILRHVTMRDIERLRHPERQKNICTFPTADSGWIEIANIQRLD